MFHDVHLATMMIGRELLGLYLEKDQLSYTCMKRTASGWSPKRPSPAAESSGTVYGPESSNLKGFLTDVLTPQKRRIYLALPRNRFFSRDMQLPLMPMEDALASVQSSLSILCHLPIDEIYHDIYLCNTSQDGIHVLVFYAHRKDVDVYFDIFQDTGHLDFLKGIFPVSYGIGAWLYLQQYQVPMGLIFSQDGAEELTVYHSKGCLSSVSWPLSGGEEECDRLLGVAKAKFPELNGRIFYLTGEDSPVLPPPTKNRFEKLATISENLSVAALAPALSGRQQISVDANSTKIKRVRLRWIIIPLVLALFLLVGFLTWRADQMVLRQEQSVKALENRVLQLRKRLEPVEQSRLVLKKAKKVIQDMDDFMGTKPRLYSHVNDIARLVPDGTWFSNFSFEKGVITVKGESGDALKVVESLRSSGLFDQVKLIGSVSRTKSGAERFKLTIELKSKK